MMNKNAQFHNKHSLQPYNNTDTSKPNVLGVAPDFRNGFELAARNPHTDDLGGQVHPLLRPHIQLFLQNTVHYRNYIDKRHISVVPRQPESPAKHSNWLASSRYLENHFPIARQSLRQLVLATRPSFW
jgi:hypothetical protein